MYKIRRKLYIRSINKTLKEIKAGINPAAQSESKGKINMKKNNTAALEAGRVIKEAGRGMTLKEISVKLHWNTPILRSRIYNGLLTQVAIGTVTYEKNANGKGKVFNLVAGKELMFKEPKTVKKAKSEKKEKRAVATEVVEPVANEAIRKIA